MIFFVGVGDTGINANGINDDDGNSGGEEGDNEELVGDFLSSFFATVAGHIKFSDGAI